ncbi:MAG: HYR domain-containing protein, partial [Verrucomicrobiota bacterium]
YQNIHTGIDDLNGTQFALVATEDGTTVFIRPSVETEGHAAGVVYTLTMNRGETYQLRNRNDAPADLSGTLVASDKPIAVFGSHQCANLPSNNTFFCDYLVEHLVPIERAGTLFFAVPLKNRTNGDTYRFWALADDTVVRVNGVVVATIDRYEFHEQLIFGRAKLTSNKPMLVNLYANSADHDLPPAVNADPFMVVLPHAGQFLSQQVVCTPDEGFTENYLNVIAPNAVVGTLTLDGAAVPAAQFQPIPGSGYSGAQLSVTPGAHRLSASLPFAVVAYGWAEYESYGFPAGMYFGDTRPPEVVCNDDPIEVVLTAQSTCFVPVPDRRDGVIVDDNCKLPDRVVVRQDPAPGTLVGPGKHIITVSATDAHGNVGFCEIEFNVIDPSPIILNCPKEVTARCKGPEGTRVFYEVTARKRCEQNIQIECVPPPGSLFPEGTTIVSCTATDAFGNRQTCTFPVTVRCPIITATLTSPNQATLSWSQGRLESAPSVTGPWSVVPNAVSPYTAELTSGQGYYRVIPPPQ